MAENCSDDDDAKAGIRKLRKSVIEELKMHDSFASVSIDCNMCECNVFAIKFLLDSSPISASLCCI